MATARWPEDRLFPSPNVCRTIVLHALWILVLGVQLITPAAAQYTTASLGGTVQDPAGAVIPGAAVTVENEDTGLSRTATSQPDGTFLIPALPVGGEGSRRGRSRPQYLRDRPQEPCGNSPRP